MKQKAGIFFCVLLLLLVSCGLARKRSCGEKAPIKVVLDTDIGTDFDDTFALFFMLARRDIFDVRLVQCSTFNTSKRAQIVANILRFDVPVGLGAYSGEHQMPSMRLQPITRSANSSRTVTLCTWMGLPTWRSSC